MNDVQRILAVVSIVLLAVADCLVLIQASRPTPDWAWSPEWRDSQEGLAAQDFGSACLSHAVGITTFMVIMLFVYYGIW